MQRQSLGSPSTKNLHLHHHQSGIGILPKDEPHESFKYLSSSSSTSSNSLSTNNASLIHGGEEEDEVMKKLRLKPKTNTTPPAESYIHLIPMLTLLCFLILYLSSHSPSQNDLAQFNGFKSLHMPADSVETQIQELQGTVGIGKGDFLAIRSLKHRRLHRKIVRF